MSTTCLYADVVLPTATWYEKNDLNTTDMHPFVHPLSAAVDPVWEAKSDWEIYKAIARQFSTLAVGHLGVEQDVVLQPDHARFAGRNRPGVRRRGLEARRMRPRFPASPRRRSSSSSAITRTRTSATPRWGRWSRKLGNGAQGHDLADGRQPSTDLGALNRRVTEEGQTQGMPRIDTDIDAAETILFLAPETNGDVAVKAWEELVEADRP